MSDVNNTETLADVLAEMRRGTRLPGYWRSCDVNRILQYHADLIDAAWKRERDILIYSFDPAKAAKSLAPDGSAYALEALEHPQSAPVGNAAAMRETLVRVRGWLERMNKERLDKFAESQITPAYAVNRQAKTIIEDNEYHIEQIDAALSAPPRNCDRFTEKADVLKAYDKPVYCGKSASDFIDWLFDTATEGATDGSK